MLGGQLFPYSHANATHHTNVPQAGSLVFGHKKIVNRVNMTRPLRLKVIDEEIQDWDAVTSGVNDVIIHGAYKIRA